MDSLKQLYESFTSTINTYQPIPSQRAPTVLGIGQMARWAAQPTSTNQGSSNPVSASLMGREGMFGSFEPPVFPALPGAVNAYQYDQAASNAGTGAPVQTSSDPDTESFKSGKYNGSLSLEGFRSVEDKLKSVLHGGR